MALLVQDAGSIGGRFTIDFDRALPNAAGPLTSFAARQGEQAGFIAISVQRGWPARARVLAALNGIVTPNLLSPLAHGPAVLPTGKTGYFVICQAPSGPPIGAALRAWPEAEITGCVVKPIAMVLADLQARNVTHRAIRPGNIFQAAPRTPVTLGCAWAAPPACHQPAWMEPPYSAMCLPAGRGDGAIADDVYALGALLVMLAIGAHPMEGLSDEMILRRKQDVGSFAAIAGNHRLPSALAELVRGMLADDPEHRPSPALLFNPDAARARRIAARPPHRAQRAIEVGNHQAATARTLAHALQHEPETGVLLLRNGMIDRWLRRSLGEPSTAGQVDDAVRVRDAQASAGNVRADALLITSVITVLDPLAPLVWRSTALWPDGLGPALDYALHHAPPLSDQLAEIASEQVGRIWMERRSTGRDVAVERLEALDVRSWLAGRTGSGALRLSYSLNPLAPCESPMAAAAWVTRLPELLPAIEDAAAGLPREGRPLVDADIAAFIAARRDERLDSDLNRFASAVSPADYLSQARLLARLQLKLMPGPMPHIAAWMEDALRPLLEQFGSRSRRDRLAAQLSALCKAGQLTPVVALMDDASERKGDADGLVGARARIDSIDATLAHLAATSGHRAAQARRIGHDIASGLAVLACVGSLAATAFL